MGIRVARTTAAALAFAVGVTAIAPAAVRAQSPSGKELFQLSGSCAAPDASLATLAPLSNLATLLQTTNKVRVLAIGNALGGGANGVFGQQRYTDELEEILESAVKDLDLVFTHRGVSGEPMVTTAERLKQEFAILEPDLVLWQVGSYDALSHTPVAEFEAVFSGVVEWIKQQGKDIVIVGMQYTTGLSKAPHYRAIKDAVLRVASRQNVLLVRRYEAIQFMATASRERAKLTKDDFLMTELGQKCMAEHVARALVVNIFARRASDARNRQLAKSRAEPHDGHANEVPGK